MNFVLCLLLAASGAIILIKVTRSKDVNASFSLVEIFISSHFYIYITFLWIVLDIVLASNPMQYAHT